MTGFGKLNLLVLAVPAWCLAAEPQADRLSSSSALALAQPATEANPAQPPAAKPSQPAEKASSGPAVAAPKAAPGAKPGSELALRTPPVPEKADPARTTPSALAPLVPANDPSRLRLHGWMEAGCGSGGYRYEEVGVGVQKKISDSVNLGLSISVFSGNNPGWWRDGHPGGAR